MERRARLLRLHSLRSQRVAHDLAEHLHQRVQTQIEDVLDTAQIAGVPAGMINEMVIGRLLAFAAFFWRHQGGTKQEFVAACDELFEEWLHRTNENPPAVRGRGVRVRRRGLR